MIISRSQKPFNKFFLFLYWLLLFLPLAIEHYAPQAETLAIIIRSPIFIIALSGVIGNIIKEHIKKSYLFFLIVLLLWELVCIVIHTPSAILSFLSDTFQIVEVVIILFYSFKYYGIKGLIPLYYVSLIYIILSFVIMVFHPNGLYISSAASSVERAQWLFGSKNNIAIYIVTFTLVVIIVRTQKNILSNMFTYLIVMLSFICVSFAGEDTAAFMTGSSTGIIMCVFLILTAWYSNKGLFCSGKRMILSANRVIIIILAANIILLGGLSISYFNDFIVNVLNKSDSFSGRLYVWKSVLNYISLSPITGHGITRVLFYGNTLTSTYNVFLGLMKNYGIPSVILIVSSMYRLKSSSSRNVQISMIGLVICLINGLMSQVHIKFIVFFMTLIYLFYEFEAQENKKDCEKNNTSAKV